MLGFCTGGAARSMLRHTPLCVQRRRSWFAAEPPTGLHLLLPHGSQDDEELVWPERLQPPPIGDFPANAPIDLLGTACHPRRNKWHQGRALFCRGCAAREKIRWRIRISSMSIARKKDVARYAADVFACCVVLGRSGSRTMVVFLICARGDGFRA